MPVRFKSTHVMALERRTLSTLQRQVQAMNRLQRSQQALSRKMTLQARALRVQHAGVRKFAVSRQRELNALATKMQLQQFQGVVNSVQSAAFGESGSVFSTNNLLLAGNQLFWSVIDPVLRGFGYHLGSSPSLLEYIAPVGSLVTGEFALGERQHVRFITGIAVFDGTRRSVLDPLRDRVASGLFPDFQRRTDIPVSATPIDLQGGGRVFGRVEDGVLVISVSSEALPRGRVAWMVDTGVNGG